MRYNNVNNIAVKNKKKIKRLIPDIKIKLNQVKNTKKVCPISGCVTKRNIIGKIAKKLKKYLEYKLLFSSEHKMVAINTIIKGFRISIGWNLGKNKRSTHLFDPLISTPITGTNKRKMKQTKNNIIEILNKVSSLSKEKNIIKNIPIPI